LRPKQGLNSLIQPTVSGVLSFWHNWGTPIFWRNN